MLLCNAMSWIIFLSLSYVHRAFVTYLFLVPIISLRRVQSRWWACFSGSLSFPPRENALFFNVNRVTLWLKFESTISRNNVATKCSMTSEIIFVQVFVSLNEQILIDEKEKWANIMTIYLYFKLIVFINLIRRKTTRFG